MTMDEIVASFTVGSAVGFYHPVKGCYVAAYIYKVKKNHVKLVYLGHDGELLTDRFEFRDLVHPPQKEIDKLNEAIGAFFKQGHIKWLIDSFDIELRKKK